VCRRASSHCIIALAVSTKESQFQIASVWNKAGAEAVRKDLQVADSAFREGRVNCELYIRKLSSIALQISIRMSSLKLARDNPEIMMVGRQTARHRRHVPQARHKPKRSSGGYDQMQHGMGPTPKCIRMNCTWTSRMLCQAKGEVLQCCASNPVQSHTEIAIKFAIFRPYMTATHSTIRAGARSVTCCGIAFVFIRTCANSSSTSACITWVSIVDPLTPPTAVLNGSGTEPFVSLNHSTVLQYAITRSRVCCSL